MRSQLRADRERAGRRTFSFPKPLEQRQPPPPAPPARGLRRLFRRPWDGVTPTARAWPWFRRVSG